MSANDSSALPHSTAPTIGEATMTDHSSVDALSDDEVAERLLVALGWTKVTRGFGGVLYATMPSPEMYRAKAPELAENEAHFAAHVIPALDERGLGVKYTEALESEMERASGYEGPPGYRAFCWDLIKAPLSLRARAALSVLENAHG